MNEIICPHCQKAFKIDEAGYADIVKQIRDREFESRLKERLDAAHRDAESAKKLAEAEAKTRLDEATAGKDLEIERLRGQLANAATQQSLEVQRATAALERERDQLKNSLDSATTQHELVKKTLAESYQMQIKDRDEAIERLKDLKDKLSTKMLGETLEKHCQIAFEQLRATAFQGCIFEKDNNAASGSKGDYIFREPTGGGVDVVSIMFEMKNESDTTATKQRNEDFFAKLDKDRTDKGCEYAILVSMLERDNELYNAGIVDVSHRYPKMYVVRPQFFIPIITLLRNAAQNSLKYKSELAAIKSQHVDITNFEQKLEEFKDAFGNNVRLAKERFDKAIDAIDKTIDNLKKVKEFLLGVERNLRLADDKAQEVTIKRLTRDSPSVARLFADSRRAEKSETNTPDGAERGS
jgi:hypothetical protein